MQGPLRCNLVTEQPGFFYLIHHDFLMDALNQTKYITFLSISLLSWEWVVQEVGVPIPVKKGNSILLHDTAFSEADCLSIDWEVQLYLDKSRVFGNKATPSSSLPTTISTFVTVAVSLVLSPPIQHPLSRPIHPLPFPLTYICDMVPGLLGLMLVYRKDKLEAVFQESFPQYTYRETSVKTAKTYFGGLFKWRMAIPWPCFKVYEVWVLSARLMEVFQKQCQWCNSDLSGTTHKYSDTISEPGINPSMQAKLLIIDEMKDTLLALDLALDVQSHLSPPVSLSSSHAQTPAPTTSPSEEAHRLAT